MSDTSKIKPIRIENYQKPNGVASLDSNGKIPAEQMPLSVTIRVWEE